MKEIQIKDFFFSRSTLKAIESNKKNECGFNK